MAPHYLDRRSSEPLYFQLKRIIQSQIASGEFDDNGFPSERELEQRYRVSKTTVRLALGKLQDDGCITRQRGRRTSVIRSKLRCGGTHLASFSDELQTVGHYLDMRPLRFGTGSAPRRVAEAFEAPATQEFFIAERLGVFEGEPILVSSVYIPRKPPLEITEADLRGYGSVIRMLEERLGISIIGGSRTLEAVRADDRESSLLGVEPGAALLMKTTLAYAANGAPICYIKARFRADRYQYFVPFLPRRPDQFEALAPDLAREKARARWRLRLVSGRTKEA